MATYQDTTQYSYIGDKNVLGGLPVVEQTQAFIATFKGVVSSTPEQIANSSFFITYLVDETGKVYKVAEDSDAQRDIIYNFSPGDDVIVRIDQGTLLNTQLAGEHKVTGIGSFVPILVTQTGSSDNAFVPFINFQNPGEVSGDDLGLTIPNFLASSVLSGSTSGGTLYITDPGTSTNLPVFWYNPTEGFKGLTEYGDQIVSGSNIDAKFARDYTPNYQNYYTASIPDVTAASWSMDSGFAQTGSYQIANPKIDINSLTFRVSYGIFNINFISCTARIGLFRDRTGTITLIDYADVAIPAIENISDIYALATLTSGNTTFNVSTNDIDADDKFFTIISSPSVINRWAANTTIQFLDDVNSSNGMRIATLSQSLDSGLDINAQYLKFEVSAQSPGSSVTEPQPDYFTSGSSASTVITASSVLSSEYSNYQTLPTASADFGFSPINYPFEVRPGDKIRFGYNTENIFTVFNVAEPPGSSLLYITLDRAVGSNLNLKNVVIYRNLTDGKFITLDVPKNDPQFSEIDFTGIIIPRYASPKLKENANEIVAKLKSEGILTEE